DHGGPSGVGGQLRRCTTRVVTWDTVDQFVGQFFTTGSRAPTRAVRRLPRRSSVPTPPREDIDARTHALRLRGPQPVLAPRPPRRTLRRAQHRTGGTAPVHLLDGRPLQGGRLTAHGGPAGRS